mgnify:FL=1
MHMFITFLIQIVKNLTGELDGCYGRQMIPGFVPNYFFSDPFIKIPYATK